MSSLHSLDLGPPNDYNFSDSDESDCDDHPHPHHQNSEKSMGSSSGREKEWLHNSYSSSSSSRHLHDQSQVVDEVSFAPFDHVVQYYEKGFCNLWDMIPSFVENKKKRRRMVCVAALVGLCIFSFVLAGNNKNGDGGDDGDVTTSLSSLIGMRSSDNEDANPNEKDDPPNLMAEAPPELDQETISAVEQAAERPCLINGDFTADPPTSNWYFVHSELKAIVEDNTNVMSIIHRTNQQWGGIWQNIPSSCLEEGSWYEVRAYYHLVSSANEEEEYKCDPTIYWNNNVESCPAISIRVDKDVTEIGRSVGPFSTEEGTWNEIYGTFRVTNDMLHRGVSIFVAGAPIQANIILQNISLTKKANSQDIITGKSLPDDDDDDNSCSSSSIIKNGNAETGDYRYWFIRGEGGEGSGEIQISSPGYGNTGYALKHVGYRNQRWRGLLQKLSDVKEDCLVVGSTWKITAVFKYFLEEEGGGEVPLECIKSDPYAVHSCPVFQVDFFTPGTQDFVSTGPMANEDTEEFQVYDWNRLEHTLEIVEEMVVHSDVWIYINSVEEGFNYEIDEIEMIRVD